MRECSIDKLRTRMACQMVGGYSLRLSLKFIPIILGEGMCREIYFYAYVYVSVCMCGVLLCVGGEWLTSVFGQRSTRNLSQRNPERSGEVK